MEFRRVFLLILGLYFLIDTVNSNHIHFWRRNEQYDNKIIANQFNITEEPLQAQSVTSCGRLCSNLRRSPAFSYMETFCYMYNSKPTDSDIFTTLGGAVYYSEEPNAKSIKGADKMYTYLDGVDLCVQVYSDWRNSTDAAEKCQSDGGHLITLDTTEKLHALSTFVLQKTLYQIGLEKTEGNWRWTRDNTLVFDPSLWYTNEPNGQNSSPPELCGGFCKCGGKPGIFDVPCNTPYPFICEY
ncbi:uncharacterized protein LOC128159309 [Crassostrea angulata]|uniref:uncharacterized protein LOC128159309 n=1 Tax=Magallana angulata TaxID=2784310 RepID=UPI0022B0C879|nr:uncharacterized protein LOC128159309 [Crassostrea angulata]